MLRPMTYTKPLISSVSTDTSLTELAPSSTTIALDGVVLPVVTKRPPEIRPAFTYRLPLAVTFTSTISLL